MDSQTCDFTYGVTDVKVEEDCEKFEYEEQENILSMHSFLESPEGSTVISLFREFLEYIGLKLTISAYETEVESFYQYSGRTELAHNLKLDPDQEGPLIVQVLSESIVCRPKLAASEVASICSSTDEVVEEPTSDCEDIVINTEDLDEDNKDLDFVKVITVDSDTPTSSWRLLPTISRTNTRSLKRTKLDDNPGQSDNGRQQDNGNNTIVQNQILLSPGVYEVGNDNALTRKHHRCEKNSVPKKVAKKRKLKLSDKALEDRREKGRERQRRRRAKLSAEELEKKRAYDRQYKRRRRDEMPLQIISQTHFISKTKL